jgi:hypothetical protein
MLFNRQQDGRMACYLYYDRPSASFLLVNDSGEGTTRQPTGAAAHLENSQCDLDVSASSAVVAGNELNVRAALTFKPGFSGIMNIYLFSDDSSGQSTGLHKEGTWYVP